MKRPEMGFGILAMPLVLWTSSALAHEECDDDSPKPAALAETAKQETSANVTI